MKTRCYALAVFAVTVSAGSQVMAQTRGDLSGRWVREGSGRPVMDDLAPAWEQIAVQDGVVMIVRPLPPAIDFAVAVLDASAPPTAGAEISPILVAGLPEAHAADGVERPSVRRQTTRACRSSWDAGRFVIECQDNDRGPGGKAPPVSTREIRSLDETGRLVVQVTWQSEDRTVTRTAAYVREAR